MNRIGQMCWCNAIELSGFEEVVEAVAEANKLAPGSRMMDLGREFPN